MFETGVRQFRLAMSMVWGRRLDVANIERLIADARATLAEFGAPGDDVQQLLDGPFSDPRARRQLQERALQTTARRLMRVSPFYRRVLQESGVAPGELNLETMLAVPPTRKADLLASGPELLATD